MEYRHIPVMMAESIEYLEIEKGGLYIDATLGGGGYTKSIAEKTGSKGRVIAFDLD